MKTENLKIQSENPATFVTGFSLCVRTHKRTLFKGRTYKRKMKNEDQFINQYRFPLGDPDQAIALMGAFRFWYMDSQIMQREYLHAGHHCI